MNFENARKPCTRCGRHLHTGEGKVMVSFLAEELEELAWATGDESVSNRLLCALGLLDPFREKEIRKEMNERGLT